ncbi:hypothetical protein NEIRO03_0124 [Nematocida sp. AWRm78]|nr:hypothetical protein NEIRO02_0063 [Nematocida sp. AWRm79]KAI5182440.1 hypothetical protein NEIRO03_0124 [Nematocida sp. AWRm78]
MDAQIYSIEYANARAAEIKEIEASIAATKKNKMLFQTLPFHKRRRTASFDERRLPKEYRRRARTKRRQIKQSVKDQKNLLKAHTWYAKRFNMYKRGNMAVPFKRHSKSEGFIAKAYKTRGVLCDVSCNQVYIGVTSMPTQSIIDKEYNRSIIWSGEDIITQDSKTINGCLEGRSIVITESKEWVNSNVTSVQEIENLSVFEVFGKQTLFAKSELVNCKKIEDLIDSETPSYISMRVENKSYVIVSRKHCMWLLQKCVCSGIVPCSILELRRMATETERIVYPYDIPQNPHGKAFLLYLASLEEELQRKRPKGKKDVIFQPLYEKELGTQKILLFTATKGSFPPKSPVIQSDQSEEFIMQGNEEIIGEVGRSSFSFAKGRTAGILYIDENAEITKNLFVRNLKNNIFRRIEYTVATSGMIL